MSYLDKTAKLIKIIRRNSGFTLIELLVVIAIIGVLVSIVIIAIDPVSLIGGANDSKKRQELQQVKNSLQLYFNDNQDYPTSGATGEFLSVGPSPNFTPDYMRQLPTVFTDTTPTAFYTDVPTGALDEYRAGVDLDNPNPPNNDGDTFNKCDQPAGSILGAWVAAGADYFICPD